MLVMIRDNNRFCCCSCGFSYALLAKLLCAPLNSLTIVEIYKSLTPKHRFS